MCEIHVINGSVITYLWNKVNWAKQKHEWQSSKPVSLLIANGCQVFAVVTNVSLSLVGLSTENGDLIISNDKQCEFLFTTKTIAFSNAFDFIFIRIISLFFYRLLPAQFFRFWHSFFFRFKEETKTVPFCHEQLQFLQKYMNRKENFSFHVAVW